MSRIKKRLEYLRGELRAERISLEELLELQSLAEHIEAGDVELLEAAGVPEFAGDEDEDEDEVDPICGSCGEPASKHSNGGDDFSHCPDSESK